MSTPVAIEQVLGYQYLTGTVQAVRTGIPNPLPDAFFKVSARTVGKSGRYTRLTGVRDTSRRVEYGSPAYRRALKDVGQFDVTLVHTYEEMMIDPLLFQTLRGYDSYQPQENGIQEIDRQGNEFGQRFDNLRIATVGQALSLGKNYFNSDGQLLPSSSGAQITIDFGINATTNQGAGQDMSGTALRSASWATGSTNIPGDIRRIITTAVQRTGYEIGQCIYGTNIPDYIANNDEAQAYLARHPRMRDAYLDGLGDQGELPDGLFGIKRWIPAYKMFFADKDGTVRQLWDGDLAVFCPEVNNEWWDMMEGTYMVPTTLNVASDMMAARGSLKTVQGKFRYAVPCHNPPTYTTYQGDTFLGIIKNPDAIYQIDTVP